MLAQRTGLLGAFFAALLAAAPNAGAETWRNYTSAPDGFAVEVSGEVKVSPQALDAATQERVVRSTQYLQDGGGYAYMVIASLTRIPPNFEAGVDGSFNAMRCKQALPRQAVPLAEGRAVEIMGTDCFGGQLQVIARYFVKGNWFYQVLSAVPAGGEENAARFVRSFKVIGP